MLPPYNTHLEYLGNKLAREKALLAVYEQARSLHGKHNSEQARKVSKDAEKLAGIQARKVYKLEFKLHTLALEYQLEQALRETNLEVEACKAIDTSLAERTKNVSGTIRLTFDYSSKMGSSILTSAKVLG